MGSHSHLQTVAEGWLDEMKIWAKVYIFGAENVFGEKLICHIWPRERE
jgi:hypothetical protein